MVQVERLALWCGRHVAPSPLVNRAARRILIALVVAGRRGRRLARSSPRFDPSAEPIAVTVAADAGPPAPPVTVRHRRRGARGAAVRATIGRPPPAIARPSRRGPARTSAAPPPIPPRRLAAAHRRRPARPRCCAQPSTRASSASGRSSASRASRRRSCSPTARSGAATPVWPTSRRRDRSRPTPRSRSRASRRRSPRRSSSALVEDGRLDLDASGDELPADPADRPRDHVRQLLDHTSGLRDFYFGAGVDQALLSKPARVWDPARSLKYLGKPYAKPGTAWHYSNTNYLVLGLVAEAVGGAPLADQLQDAVLRPARARPHVLPVGRGSRGGPSPAATGSSAPTRSCPPSTCPTAPRSCRSPRS